MRNALVPSVRTLVVAAALAIVVGCTRTPPTGSMAITIVGLPDGLAASVAVVGTNANRTVTGTEVLTGLPVGTYQVTAATVTREDPDFAGLERFDGDSQTVQVGAGAQADATVTYAYAGFTIADAAGDAVGDGSTYPAFDVIEFRSRVDGTDLVFELDFASGADDLTDLAGYVDIDVDRDSSTGVAGGVGAPFCADAAPLLGIEVTLDLFTDQAIDPATFDVLAPMTRSVSANTVTLRVATSDLGSDDGWVRAHATIGNPDAPTDCVPYGPATPL